MRKKKNDLANFKSEADELDVKTDVVKKTKYDELAKKVNAVDTRKRVNKTDYNAKIKGIEGKIPSITGLATTAGLNPKINEAKGEITSITG